MSKFERIVESRKAKRASKTRTGGGIKAIITIGDLQSVVAAAKKWQAKCVEDGVDASKLLHHIANAEAVIVKYSQRNKLAFERRERYRQDAKEDAERFGDGEPPSMRREIPPLGTAAWGALDSLSSGGKGNFRKEAARPTRW